MKMLGRRMIHWDLLLVQYEFTVIYRWFTRDFKNAMLNYNDLTATSLGIMVSKGNHPQMALIQVSELL